MSSKDPCRNVWKVGEIAFLAQFFFRAEMKFGDSHEAAMKERRFLNEFVVETLRFVQSECNKRPTIQPHARLD
jgi:hypothetical protein